MAHIIFQSLMAAQIALYYLHASNLFPLACSNPQGNDFGLETYGPGLEITPAKIALNSVIGFTKI